MAQSTDERKLDLEKSGRYAIQYIIQEKMGVAFSKSKGRRKEVENLLHNGRRSYIHEFA